MGNNKLDEMTGKAKEAAGRITGDRDTEAEGQADQVKANVKQAADNVKDAAKKLTGQ